MNDEQIVKALEHCKRPTGKHDCENCPYVYSRGTCTTNMLNDTIDHINRQKAEIEMLKHDRKKLKREFFTVRYEAKSEAVKEFMQKHREIMMEFRDDDDQISLKVCEYDANTNNLVKEMGG